MILVGEPYWVRVPASDDLARACHARDRGEWSTLPELVASLLGHGLDLVQKMLASPDDWDAYHGLQWLTSGGGSTRIHKTSSGRGCVPSWTACPPITSLHESIWVGACLPSWPDESLARHSPKASCRRDGGDLALQLVTIQIRVRPSGGSAQRQADYASQRRPRAEAHAAPISDSRCRGAARGQPSRRDARVLTVVQFRAVPACIGVWYRPPRLNSARRMLRANPSGVHRYNVRPMMRASSRLVFA